MNGGAARAARLRYQKCWCANCPRRLAGEMEE
nr:MAG TPA: WCCH motif protein [Caudoviricetes sp.]DAZ64669.1 MAG TPA: WCCH motif protein [Caudoviricetes sp.]